jgi:rRNA maturation endonuclease Nob1
MSIRDLLVRPERHRHKCEACGHIWEHASDNAGDTEAHTCPKCGTELESWEWYIGE